MNNARYLFRLDDITPTMDWGRFWALMRLFQRHRVKPLLGVIPDNHDRSLDRQKPNRNFWEIMNLLVERDLCDIAQHGYQHILDGARPESSPIGNGGRAPKRSEFAGYSFQEQLEKIQRGREILRSRGIHTDYFFAPNHSFDFTTLSALRSAGFTAVSDGLALRPFQQRGLIFVPQQLWRPIWMPTGTFTVCLHANEITPQQVHDLRRFLRTPARVSRFTSEAQAYKPMPLDSVVNTVFRSVYGGARLLRGATRSGTIQKRRANATPRPPLITQPRIGRDSISSI